VANGQAVVQAYVAEMCTAPDGLQARRRARRSTETDVSVSHWWDQDGRWNIRYVCGS
jgi:hypothetical protein